MNAPTEEQCELLRDKYAVWVGASVSGNMEQRDYYGRCAEALKALLCAHAESLAIAKATSQ